MSGNIKLPLQDDTGDAEISAELDGIHQDINGTVTRLATTVDTDAKTDKTNTVPDPSTVNSSDYGLPAIVTAVETYNNNGNNTELLLSDSLTDSAVGSLGGNSPTNTGVTIDENGYLVFDGSSYLTHTNLGSVLAADAEWTIDVDISSSDSRAVMCIMGINATVRLDFLWFADPDNTVDIGAATSDTVTIPHDDSWYRYSVEKKSNGDGTYNMYFYLDGILKTTQTNCLNDTYNTWLWGWEDGTSGRELIGKLANIRVSSTALYGGASFTTTALSQYTSIAPHYAVDVTTKTSPDTTDNLFGRDSSNNPIEIPGSILVDSIETKTQMAVIQDTIISGFNLKYSDLLGYASIVEATRTFTIAPKTGIVGVDSFDYVCLGVAVSKTSAENVVWDDTTGTHIIYYDTSSVLSSVLVTTGAQLAQLAYDGNVLVHFVNWNATQSKVLVSNREIHGFARNIDWWIATHATDGAKYSSGLIFTGLTAGIGTFTSISSGVIYDEDIPIEIASATTMETWFRYGPDGDWYKYTGTLDNNLGFFFTFDGTNFTATTKAVWNEWTGTTWQLTESTSTTDFYNMLDMSFGNNGALGQAKIVAQAAYSSKANARKGVETDIENLNLDGIPSPEMIVNISYLIADEGLLVTQDDDSLYYNIKKSVIGFRG